MAKGKKARAEKGRRPEKKRTRFPPWRPRVLPICRRCAGVRLATGEAGIKYRNRADVLLAILAPGTEVAGVFTRSKTASAPVDWCRAQLKHGHARALVVNSGNANAFTGQAGMAGTRAVAEAASAVVGCKASEIFLASTGVISKCLLCRRLQRFWERWPKTRRHPVGVRPRKPS